MAKQFAARGLVPARAILAGVAALLTIASGPLLGQVVAQPIPGDPVSIASGQVAGRSLQSGVRAYWGVPFAAPPVRDLRWRDPQPVASWQGIYHADRFAPECIQTLRAHNINHYFGEEATSEDCLYLNIWAPPQDANSTRRPVVVWIYGGGFTIGSAAMANYSGESLASQGLVFVSLAYRLGALGFLSHPSLTAESPRHASGNYGFLDQLAALRWVQDNIASFGGDPACVTIMGQSAGSMSVSLLQASPLARGLFHRAVGMSGSALGPGVVTNTQTLDQAEADGLEFQHALKAESLNAMRDLPADRILQTQLAVSARYHPIIDHYLLPATPDELFAAGKQSDVPAMIGFTRDESFSELAQAKTLAAYRESARRLYGDRAPELLRLYPATDDLTARRAATDAGRDSSVGRQMRSWARAQIGAGKHHVYVYLFSRVHPYVSGVTFADHDPVTVGAYHTGDLPYWLGTLDSLNRFRITRNWTDFDRNLSESMMNAIIAFATNGDPNTGAAISWPAYSSTREQVREFGDTARVVPWPDVDRLKFFDAGSITPPASPPAINRNRD